MDAQQSRSTAAPQSSNHHDPLGFPMATAPISGVDIGNIHYRIEEAIERAAVLLRTLHYRLLTDNSDNLTLGDVERLVGVVLEQLPKYDGEEFRLLDKFRYDATQACREAREGQIALRKMVLAFENATWEGLQFDEAQICAGDVFAAKDSIPQAAFNELWEVFCKALARRGFQVDIKPGVGQSYVEVSDAATRKMVRKVTKAAQKFVAEAEQERAKRR